MSIVGNDGPARATTGIVRNDTATLLCPQCGTPFTPFGRRQWCSDACRQTAWRRRNAAPQPVLPAKNTTIYQGPDCDTRYLGQQRCADCNTWCQRIGPGGTCPHCDEPVAIEDLTNQQPSQPTRDPTQKPR